MWLIAAGLLAGKCTVGWSVRFEASCAIALTFFWLRTNCKICLAGSLEVVKIGQ